MVDNRSGDEPENYPLQNAATTLLVKCDNLCLYFESGTIYIDNRFHKWATEGEPPAFVIRVDEADGAIIAHQGQKESPLTLDCHSDISFLRLATFSPPISICAWAHNNIVHELKFHKASDNLYCIDYYKNYVWQTTVVNFFISSSEILGSFYFHKFRYDTKEVFLEHISYIARPKMKKMLYIKREKVEAIGGDQVLRKKVLAPNGLIGTQAEWHDDIYAIELSNKAAEVEKNVNDSFDKLLNTPSQEATD